MVTVPVPEHELNSKDCNNIKACYHQSNLAGTKGNVSTVVSAIVEDEIPDELILNVDQTPSKLVPMDYVTMAGREEFKARTQKSKY